MAMICIGGVCVPYSALVPLLLLALKWLAGILAKHGLLPKAIQERISVHAETAAAQANAKKGRLDKKKRRTQSSDSPSLATQSTNSSTNSSDDDALVKHFTDDDDWNAFVKANENATIIVKWTATWCQPCKAIQPHFEELAQKYSEKAVFCTADTDELDEAASACAVAMLPTFCVLQNGKPMTGSSSSKYSGSDQQQLTDFVEKTLGCCRT